MAALEIDFRRRPLGRLPVELVEQNLQTPRGLDVLPGRVQPEQLGIAQELDGAPSREATRSATWFMPQLLRRADASAHMGD